MRKTKKKSGTAVAAPEKAPLSTSKEAPLTQTVNAPKPTAAHRAYWRHACLRIQYIHDQLSSEKFPTRTTIARHFECGPRTITRDLAHMRDQMGLPIEFHQERGGFYYTRAVRELPRPKLTSGEMLTMVVARLSLERYSGTSFAAEIATSFKRFASAFSSEVDCTWDELAHGLSFRACNLQSPETLESSRIIYDAVAAGEELEFFYWGLWDDEPIRRRVWPYHLTCDGKGWYLFGRALDRDDIREFHLVRISRIQQTGIFFEKPENFSPDEKLKHSIGVYGGDRPERIRLRLSRIPSRILAEQPLHHTQQITREDGRDPELTMDVAINPELEREIMSWADEVEVLEPAHLREKVFAKARAILAKAGGT
jgi:predicted DNA-binding transcriptional regulator YafY